MTVLHAKPVETAKARWNRIKERFDVLMDFTQATIEGISRALIISGPAGLGKSYGVEKALREWDPDGDKYTISKGYVRPTGLLKLLYTHRHEGHMIVFDDADFIFADETSLNLLKAACDTCEDRTISYLSERGIEVDGEFIPPRFDFNGAIIFLTNYDFDDMIAKDSKWSPHFAALVSRSHYIDLAMKGKEDYLTRIEMVMEEGLLSKLNKAEQKDVMTFIYEHQDDLRELSLRIALKLASCRQMKNVSDWKAMARVTCCRNSAR